MPEAEFKELKARLAEAVSFLTEDEIVELETLLIAERWDRVSTLMGGKNESDQ